VVAPHWICSIHNPVLFAMAILVVAPTADRKDMLANDVALAIAGVMHFFTPRQQTPAADPTSGTMSQK
jgi:hypothetical protein